MKTYFDKSYFMPVQKYRGEIKNIKYPCYISLKLDGELQYLIVKNHKAISVNKSKYGRIRLDYNITKEAEKLPDGIYLGELYWNEGKTIEDFHSFLSHKTDNNLKLAIWGVLEYQGEKNIITERNYEILKEIRKYLKNAQFISIITYYIVKNEKELKEIADKILKEGWEGVVIRNLNQTYNEGQSLNWIKIKKENRDVEIKASEKIEGLWNIKLRLEYLLNRKLSKKESNLLDFLGEEEVIRLEDYKIGLENGTISTYLIARIQ